MMCEAIACAGARGATCRRMLEEQEYGESYSALERKKAGSSAQGAISLIADGVRARVGKESVPVVPPVPRAAPEHCGFCSQVLGLVVLGPRRRLRFRM